MTGAAFDRITKYAWALTRVTGRTMQGATLPYPKLKEAA